jgi:A/G-specific adenine glycosylase
MNRINGPKPAAVRKNNSDNSVNSVSKTQSLVRGLLDWFSTNARDLPWRRTRDPYAVWVSEIMLQQTQVKTVIPYWERWTRELPTIEALANANADKIHKLWEGLGYYTRVRNMQKAAQQIVAEHGGKFPKTFDAVLDLPGIGRYTAGAICSIAFNQPTPILDGNVIRVLTRLYGIASDPREKQTNAQLWQLAQELVAAAAGQGSPTKNSRAKGLAPPKPPVDASSELPRPLGGEGWGEGARGGPETHCSHLNQSLMELGALICTPRSPQCLICPVEKLCVARKNNLQAQLPNLSERATATARHFVAFVVESRGQFLVRQRPTGIVNAHLWEFPNVEINGESDIPLLAKTFLGTKPVALEKLLTIKHSITRYRITLEVHRAQLKMRPAAIIGVWRTCEELQILAFSSAHQKILRHLTPQR